MNCHIGSFRPTLNQLERRLLMSVSSEPSWENVGASSRAVPVLRRSYGTEAFIPIRQTASMEVTSVVPSRGSTSGTLASMGSEAANDPMMDHAEMFGGDIAMPMQGMSSGSDDITGSSDQNHLANHSGSMQPSHELTMRFAQVFQGHHLATFRGITATGPVLHHGDAKIAPDDAATEGNAPVQGSDESHPHDSRSAAALDPRLEENIEPTSEPQRVRGMRLEHRQGMEVLSVELANPLREAAETEGATEAEAEELRTPARIVVQEADASTAHSQEEGDHASFVVRPLLVGLVLAVISPGVITSEAKKSAWRMVVVATQWWCSMARQLFARLCH